MRPSVAAAAAMLLTVATALDTVWAGQQLVERELYLMGTRVRLAVVARSRADGLSSLESAVRALEDADRNLSTWRGDSLLSAVNRLAVGIAAPIDHELCRVLAEVGDWYESTGAAFDPAVGRLVEAWGLHGTGRLPSETDVATALATSGFKHVALDREACTVTRRREVLIDADGFGKGAALERAASVLPGVAWMIDLGGQVAVGGPPPGGRGWTVSLAHPADRQRAWLDVHLVSGSLATSGGSERDLWVGGHRLGHILDPRMGHPAPFRGSVTVWHPSSLAADILSTALYVMGPVEGLRWAEARGVAVGFLIWTGGHTRQVTSSAFEQVLTD